MRRPAGGDDTGGGGCQRDGDAGAGTTGPPNCSAKSTGGAYPTRRIATRGPPWGRVGAPERARQATADRAPPGGCSALRVGLLLPLVCIDRFGGLDMHEGNYLHWLVTARVNSQLGKLDPGDGFRPF